MGRLIRIVKRIGVSSMALIACQMAALDAFAWQPDEPELSYPAPSPEIYGEDLAGRVGAKLERLAPNEGIYANHAHADTMGIVKDPNAMTVYFDGPVKGLEEFAGQSPMRGIDKSGIYVGRVHDGKHGSITVERYFATGADFAKWLADKSDATLGPCSAPYVNCSAQPLSRYGFIRFLSPFWKN